MRFIVLLTFLFSTTAMTADIKTITPVFNKNMVTEPISSIEDSDAIVEQRIRNAAVRIVAPGGKYGSGSLIKYKGLTLVLTAQHVIENVPGLIHHIVKDGEVQRAVPIYSDKTHDIGLLYMIDEMKSATPMKYSPRKNIVDIGEEITYSGHPSHHSLMTFRGRVAGYEILADAGLQILLHTHGWYGCSGAVVYDLNGDIAGIIWGIDIERKFVKQVVGNIMWVVPIQALNIDYALGAFCSTKNHSKYRACR